MPPNSKAKTQGDTESPSTIGTTPTARNQVPSTGARSGIDLTDDETLLWTGGPSLLPVVPSIGIGLIVCVSGVVMAMLSLSPIAVLPFTSLPVEIQLPASLSLVLVPIGLLIAGRSFLRRWRVRYVITSAQVSKQVGLLARDTTRLRFDHIQNTVSTQSLAGRLLSYGDISIATAGTSTTELVFEDVRHPGRVNSILARQLDGAAATPMNETPPRR